MYPKFRHKTGPWLAAETLHVVSSHLCVTDPDVEVCTCPAPHVKFLVLKCVMVMFTKSFDSPCQYVHGQLSRSKRGPKRPF